MKKGLLNRIMYWSNVRVLTCIFACGVLMSASTVSGEVIINGKQYKGDKVVVENGTVRIDGRVVERQASGKLNIVINGTLKQLQSDRAVNVDGDIRGRVHASGSVRAENIQGPVTASGRVKAEVIKGDVHAKGSVRADKIVGDVKSTGNVRCNP